LINRREAIFAGKPERKSEMDMDKDKDPFDEAIAEDEAMRKDDEWMDDEGEAPAAPSVAVVVSPEAEKPAGESAQPDAGMGAAEPAAESTSVAEEPAAEPAAEEPAPAQEPGEAGPSFEESVAQLKADFGEEFVGFIKAIAEQAAKDVAMKMGEESVGSMGKRIDALIDDIMRARHRDAIAAVHSDVEDIANSPEFQTFVDGMEEAEKAEANRVINSGTAKEIIKLLNEFKASKSSNAEQEEFELDAATAVRGSPGGPMNLAGDSPDDYGDEEEWNQDTLRLRR
jgi:hypothetical protein